jgi:acyl carrier protein
MRDEVRDLVLTACGLLNEQLEKPIPIELGEEAPLHGPGGVIDSLGLVNLIVLTEQAIEEAFGAVINLADDTTLSGETAVFASVGSLTTHIVEELEAVQ